MVSCSPPSELDVQVLTIISSSHHLLLRRQMMVRTTDEAMLEQKISEGGVQKDSISEQGITIKNASSYK